MILYRGLQDSDGNGRPYQFFTVGGPIETERTLIWWHWIGDWYGNWCSLNTASNLIRKRLLFGHGDWYGHGDGHGDGYSVNAALRRVTSAKHSAFKALHLIERLMWVNQTGTFQTSNQTICCYIRFYPLQISVMCIITKLYVLWKRKIERWTLTHTSAWQAKCCKCAPMRCVYIFAPECRQVLPCEVCRACPLRGVLLNSHQDANTDWIYGACTPTCQGLAPARTWCSLSCEVNMLWCARTGPVSTRCFYRSTQVRLRLFISWLQICYGGIDKLVSVITLSHFFVEGHSIFPSLIHWLLGNVNTCIWLNTTFIYILRLPNISIETAYSYRYVPAKLNI